MNVCVATQVAFYLSRFMNRCVVENDNNLFSGSALAKLSQEPYKCITVRLFGFFPIKFSSHDIQAAKERETFPFVTRRDPVAATFF